MPARSASSFLSVTLNRIDLDRGDRAVLRDIAWRIEPGQRWLLVGGNGAGKTQLLKLVAGSVWPKPTGQALRRYRLRREIADAPAGVMEEIAYIGAERQDRYEHYDWNFSAREIVGTGLYRTDIPMTALTRADVARVDLLLARLDVTALAERRFLTLSYGERRLVLIARALAWQPKLLLLDEVANGLDSRNHARFLRFLESSAASKLPWVFATHRREDVPESMTHLLELERGACIVAARCAPAGARELLQQESREFSAARPAPSRGNRRSRRVLVALERANVHVDDVRILHDIDLDGGGARLLGGARRERFGQVHAAANDLRRSRRRGRRESRARWHHARRAARNFQAPHGVCRAASANLARAQDAGDGSRCLGALREHRAQ